MYVCIYIYTIYIVYAIGNITIQAFIGYNASAITFSWYDKPDISLTCKQLLLTQITERLDVVLASNSLCCS